MKVISNFCYDFGDFVLYDREIAENTTTDEISNAVSDGPERKPEEDAQPDHEEKKEVEEEEDKVK